MELIKPGKSIEKHTQMEHRGKPIHTSIDIVKPPTEKENLIGGAGVKGSRRIIKILFLFNLLEP